jgi:hypothetical protein
MKRSTERCCILLYLPDVSGEKKKLFFYLLDKREGKRGICIGRGKKNNN